MALLESNRSTNPNQLPGEKPLSFQVSSAVSQLSLSPILHCQLFCTCTVGIRLCPPQPLSWRCSVSPSPSCGSALSSKHSTEIATSQKTLPGQSDPTFVSYCSSKWSMHISCLHGICHRLLSFAFRDHLGTQPTISPLCTNMCVCRWFICINKPNHGLVWVCGPRQITATLLIFWSCCC